MKFKKNYSLLYIPDGNEQSRSIHLPAWWLPAAGIVVGLLLLGTGLYLIDCSVGAAWRPGGSPLALRSERLQSEVDRFEHRVAALQADLDAVFAYQQMVAAAVDLQPLDAQVRAAGIGGRTMMASPAASETPSAAAELPALLRQARIQRQGMAAILDSLAARQEVRDRLPSIRPCDIGWLSSRFGMRRDPFTGKQAFHRGIDFSVPIGTPVRATGDGTVVAIEKQRGLGRLVKIDHGGGVVTLYGHLHEAKVRRGQRVKRGELIALSGSSGRSTAPHLHYEVRIGGRAVNPLTYILDSYAELR